MHRHNSWHMQYKTLKATQKSNIKRECHVNKSDITQSISKIIVVMFYVKISCHINMLKYYTNNVLLGRQAYCENSGVSTSIVAEQNSQF